MDKYKDFQCEILTRYDAKTKRSKKFTFVFQNDPIINQAIQVFYEANNVSMVTPKSFSFYAPVQLAGSLFQNVVSQYIDNTGKTRMLTYENGLCLMTSPIPPLNKPISQKIKCISPKVALEFMRSKELCITMQDGDVEDKKIQGLWVEPQHSRNSGISYGYIPLKIEKALKKSDVDEELVCLDDDSPKNEYIKFSPIFLNDPLRTDDESELKKYRFTRKIAEFLKQYTLFQYSLDPQHFGKESFVVKSKHDYDIFSLNKRLIKNTPVIYQNGKIIVPSNKVRDHLINFLRVQLVNNYEEVLSYSDRIIIKNYYRTLNDFRKVPQQFVFIDERSLLMWKYDKEQYSNRNNISSFVQKGWEPYYYRNYSIERGRLAIIQPVRDGKLERALGVAENWEINRINSGYDYGKLIDSNSVTYTEYSEEGKKKIFKSKDNKSPSDIKVMKTYEGEYSAFLFF